MSQQLTYLMREICSGVEIYFSGRSYNYYNKTAYVLCDDYTELTSKVFLLDDDSSWSYTRDEKEIKKFEKVKKKIEAEFAAAKMPEAKDMQQFMKGIGRGSFKDYSDVLGDVRKVIEKKYNKKISRLDELQNAMRARRRRRNDFFHTTSLLDVTISPMDCGDALCDLLEYGALLFGDKWNRTVAGTRQLETLEILLKVERKSFNDQSISDKLNRIRSIWPRNSDSKANKGVQLAIHNSDTHLMLCVINGGPEFKNKLNELLS